MPIGLVDTHWGGTNIQAWSSPAALAKCSSFNVGDGPNDHSSSLYNGMLAPLFPLQIAAAVWYQGESNVGGSEWYECALGAMIEDWRGSFGWDFPFGIVQLSGYGRVGIGCAGDECVADDSYPVADLRGAELGVVGSVPGTFLAVSVDYEDPDPLNNSAGDIHPRNKMEVGRRLGEGLRGRVTPSLSGCSVGNGTLTIELRGVAGGTVAGLTKEGIEVLKEDGTWVDAPILEASGAQVVVDTGAAKGDVAGVRYAWRDSPCCKQEEYDASACPIGGGGMCSLYVSQDGEGWDVPVSSFWAPIDDGNCV